MLVFLSTWWLTLLQKTNSTSLCNDWQVPEIGDKLVAGPHVVIGQLITAQPCGHVVLLDGIVGQMDGAGSTIQPKSPLTACLCNESPIYNYIYKSPNEMKPTEMVNISYMYCEYVFLIWEILNSSEAVRCQRWMFPPISKTILRVILY